MRVLPETRLLKNLSKSLWMGCAAPVRFEHACDRRTRFPRLPQQGAACMHRSTIQREAACSTFRYFHSHYAYYGLYTFIKSE